jgi:tape measure domain-containing protein
VAYRADIEIGVKGTRQLEQLRSLITQTTQAYESLNRIAKTRGGLIQNVANYTTQLERTRRAIDNVTMGSQAEAKAIREYVTAMGQANTARARQNYLIEQEIANRRKVQATINAGFGQQGPAVPPSMRNAGFGQLGPALPPKTAAGKGGSGIGKGISGAVSNAAIGGAFPLLFGQSGAAAAGGALGGIAGSFLGPSGGFAGSLVGTILGEKLGQGNQVKQLGEDIGFSAEQTKMLGIAFQQAGRDFDKFQQSVSTIQGLSLSIEDQARAIELASSLTETYKGKIDKVTNAFAGALSTGKVTQGTLNQLTNNGIPIQQALADKYNVSRDAILKMAKDGAISVQDLIDTLVKVGNEGTKSATTQEKAFKDAYTSIEEAGNRLATTLFTVFGGTADDINNKLNQVLLNTLGYISDLIDGFNEIAKVVGPVIKFVVDGYIAINTAIWNVIDSVPGLTQGMLQFAGTVLGPLGQVAYLVNSIRGVGAAAKDKLPPVVKPKQKPLETFTAPSQFTPAGKTDTSADKAAKAAEREAARVANIVRDRAAATEQLRLQAQYGQALFTAEVAKDSVLKIQLEREQKIGEISVQYSKDINDEKAKGNSAAVKEAFTRQALVKVQVQELLTAQDLKRLEIARAENYATLLEDLQYELALKSAVTEEQRRQLEIAYEMAKLQKNPDLTDAQREEIKRRKEQIAAPKTNKENIEERVGALRDELEQLTSWSNLAITGAEAIGTAFSNSFKGIIDGSMSAREALSSFFKSVADAFLDMAAQIIAKWIQMTILNTILSLFPGGSKGGGGKGLGQVPMDDISRYAVPLPGFAEGGYVNRPTNAMIGEGGQPEYVIPASKMRESMGRYAAGARGSAVIGSGNGTSDSGGGTATMTGSSIDVRYTVERINSVDYVTADQFQQGMQKAAMEGAQRGQQATLRRLQNSSSTRRSVGI